MCVGKWNQWWKIRRKRTRLMYEISTMTGEEKRRTAERVPRRICCRHMINCSSALFNFSKDVSWLSYGGIESDRGSVSERSFYDNIIIKKICTKREYSVGAISFFFPLPSLAIDTHTKLLLHDDTPFSQNIRHLTSHGILRWDYRFKFPEISKQLCVELIVLQSRYMKCWTRLW